MKSKNLFFISAFFFLAFVGIACSLTIWITPANIIVYANDYPNTTSTAPYQISVKNVNAFPVTVTFTESSEITSLVSIDQTSFQLQPGESRTANLVVSLNGPAYVSGTITVTFDDGNQYPVPWDVGIGIYGRSTPTPGQQCSSTATSCGAYPNCVNVNSLNGCYDGYNRLYFCSSNVAKYNPQGDSYCCGLIGGTYNNGVCSTNQSAKNITLNITSGGSPGFASISLFTPGSCSSTSAPGSWCSAGNLINSANITGMGTVGYSNSTADFKMDYDSSKMSILLKSLYLDNITTMSNIAVDPVSPAIPNGTCNMTLKRAYKISIPFYQSSKGITLSIKYSDLSVNTNLLYLCRCGNFSIETNTCNENWIPKSMSTVNGYVVADLDSFSAYAIGESYQTSATTTTSTTTTTVASSSVSDSSSSSSGSSDYSGSGLSSPTTTTITTTTLPSTTTTVPPTTTTQAQAVEQTQGPSIFTGLASLGPSNPLWFGLPVAAVAGIFLSWKFYFKTKMSVPSYNRRIPRIKNRKRKNSKDTNLIFQ